MNKQEQNSVMSIKVKTNNESFDSEKLSSVSEISDEEEV